jgi:GDP-L-fucose synthase
MSPSHINIGVGSDITIKELTEIVAGCVGYVGEIVWDTSKPDGAPRKLLNIDKIKELGWTPKTNLNRGLKLTYVWFLEKNQT